MPNSVLTLEDIRTARQTLDGKVRRTPILDARHLADGLWLKAECMQITGSFKVRGVLNKVMSLTGDEKRRGLIGASAGNHALALAWAASREGVACTVVMPSTAGADRIQAVQALGASVLLQPTMLDVFLTLHSVRQEQGLTLVHPFDDPLVMAGQGTIGLEIIEQVQNATRVVVGVGGGGLIGGIAAAIKSLRPEVEVIGVEPVGAAAMTESLRAGSAMCLAQVDTIADGLGAPYVSNATFAVASDYVDRVVLLTDDEIAGAVRRILTECKLLVEPAGAAAVAAVLSGKVRSSPGDGLVCVLSGGNIARERLITLL